MRPIKILTLVGGISQQSINRKLFHAMKDLIGSEAELVTFEINRLPFFSQDIEHDPPDSVTEYKEHIREANAVLFITPEYNRSLPGVLKNAIDWGSRPYGQNLWDKLPAAIMGASAGNIGTFGAQHHLRQILSYLNVIVMNVPEFYLNFPKNFTEAGQINNDKTRQIMLKFWESFKDWIEKMSEGRNSDYAPRFNSRGLEDSPEIH